MNKLDSNRIEEIFPPVLFLMLGAFITIFYFAVHGDNLVTSDSAADLILARVLCRDGGFLSKNWFYSTELLIFDTQFIFKPCYALFPNDWHKARLLAHSILMVIYLASMIWMIKVSKIGPKGLWAVAMCAFPIGLDYTVTVSWSMFYVPNFVFTYAMLIPLFIAIRRKDNKLLLSILLFIISFIAGLRTLRTIMQVNIPLIAVAILLLTLRKLQSVLKIDSSIIRCFDRPLFFYSSLMLIASILGYSINSLVLSKAYHFTNYNDSYWESFSIERIVNTLSDFISEYGWHERTTIISIEGISSCLGVLIGLAVIISIVLLLTKFTSVLSDIEYLIILYTAVTIIICTFIFAHNGSYSPAHWVPVIPFGYISLSIAIKHLSERFSQLQKSYYSLILGIVILITSLSWLVLPLPTYLSLNTLRPVINYVNEQGYTQGIATFWRSNVVTELTDGKIEMWTVDNVVDMHPIEWLQETSHAQLPEGRVFVIVQNRYIDSLDSTIGDYVVFENVDYTVLGFDDGDNYQLIISNSHIEES